MEEIGEAIAPLRRTLCTNESVNVSNIPTRNIEFCGSFAANSHDSRKKVSQIGKRKRARGRQRAKKMLRAKGGSDNASSSR